MDRGIASTEISLDKVKHAIENPVKKAIGVKKWNRLSKSTQAITKEITKLAESKDDSPGLTLTQFNGADYDRFFRDAEKEGCYKYLTQGFKVKNDPFSTVPGIMVLSPSPQHAAAAGFISQCIIDAGMDHLITNPLPYLICSRGIDVPLPGGGGKFEPDFIFSKANQEVPYFIVEANWEHHTREEARQQLLGPIERYRGMIRGGILLYPFNDNWYAEVYRFANRTTGGAEIFLPDGIANQEKERALMREALNSSDGDFAIYLQEKRAYTLLSNDNTPCEDVPLAMFDLFAEEYEHVVLKGSMRRPDATFWLNHNLLCLSLDVYTPHR